MTLRFPFRCLYTSNAFKAWWIFHFRGKNCPKMCLTINRPVKTPWHRPSVGSELLSPGYGLLYEHVDMIGGVTRWGGLSDLKGWNSDNLFDWIDFFKRNTYFHFLTKVRTWNKNREFFGNTELFPLTHAHFSWSERGVRGACGKKREDEFWSLLFYTLISFFYWILLEKRFYVVWISFSCAQPILIAWTSCLKLIISTEFIYCGYFCRSNCNHFEWKNA